MVCCTSGLGKTTRQILSKTRLLNERVGGVIQIETNKDIKALKKILSLHMKKLKLNINNERYWHLSKLRSHKSNRCTASHRLFKVNRREFLALYAIFYG